MQISANSNVNPRFQCKSLQTAPVRISEHLSANTNKHLTCDPFSWYNKVDLKKGGIIMKKLKKERRVNLMKKIKLFVFLMLSGMSLLFLLPVKVFAQPTPDLSAVEWYNHITQFDFGFADSEIFQGGDDKFYLHVWTEPSDDLEDVSIEYDVNEDLHYFEPALAIAIEEWVNSNYQFSLNFLIYYHLGIEDFDSYLHWNFEEKYWQVEYYNMTEIEYYIQRINYLQNQVTNLSNSLSLKNLEIQQLQREIETLEYILSTEYNRGFDDGYDEGYDDGLEEGILTGEPEAYERGFKDGQESKLAQNNEAFYQGIEKWLVPAIITVILVGGFVTIAVRKRREE